MRLKPYSNEYLKERVEAEGLEYYLERLDYEPIEDPKVRELWAQAQEQMEELHYILGKLELLLGIGE